MMRNGTHNHDHSFLSPTKSMNSSSLKDPTSNFSSRSRDLYSSNNRTYSSPMTSSAYKNTGFDGVSYVPITPKFESTVQTTSNTPQSATSVISAFRELQQKSKIIEQERSDSVRERDELRLRLTERRRATANERSRIELETTEELLNQRSINERIKHQHANISAKVAAEEDIDRSMQRGIAAQRTLIADLQDDVARNQAKIHNLQSSLTLQRDELDNISRRTKNVSDVAQSHSPEKTRNQYFLLHEQISNLEHKLEKIGNSTLRGQSKRESLQRYVELIIRINGELVETLVAREETRSRILRLSGVLGPRYAWPKQVPFGNILGLVNEAAVATATGMKELDAMRNSESAIKSVIRAMSPSRLPAEQQQFGKSPGSNKAKGKSSKDRDQEDADDWLSQLNSRRQRSSNGYNEVNSSNLLDKTVSFLDAKQYRPSSSSRYSSVDKSFDSAFSIDNNENEVKGKKIKKKKLKKVKRRHSEGNGELLPTTTPLLTSSFASTGSAYRTRRQRTRDSVIARQGAITNATRFAAAVNAAAVTSSVQNTPTPRKNPSPERLRMEAIMNTTMHADTVQSETPHKASFIPSGNQGSEFNVVASVSKANRAVKQLNATVASRVKSLHSGGAGDIFDELPRVTLHDMQHSLSAYKKVIE